MTDVTDGVFGVLRPRNGGSQGRDDSSDFWREKNSQKLFWPVTTFDAEKICRIQMQNPFRTILRNYGDVALKISQSVSMIYINTVF